MNDLWRIRQCVGIGGDFDHFPILLEIAGVGKKPPNPFKFNSSGGRNQICCLIKSNWIPYDRD